MSASPPTARRRTVAGLLAATVGVTALIVAACGQDPPPSTSPTPVPGTSNRLAVLTGPPEARRLIAYAGRVAAPLTLPPGATTWIAADPRGRLAATQADGTILVRDTERADWQVLDVGGDPPTGGQALMATWSPGGRLAAIVADVETARMTGVLIIDLAAGGAGVRPLGLGLEGSPPAWLDDIHVALPGRDHDEPRLTILDTEDGSTLAIPDPIRSLAASADGSTVAIIPADGTDVEVWRAGPWSTARRAGTEPPDAARLSVLRPPVGTVRPASLAFDPADGRVAVAWSDVDGTTAVVTVHAPNEAWAAVSRISIEPTSAVPALAWLP
jgi:hypothetical protein